ncbi:hypothetical protein PIB30_006268 [Stylosanthes scabra]|uniref:Secreted protein n=1 Tax=Stylosanthes scabra TaxID=79078 RepID=A0ABU6Q479_9FABA|nr:hypothetical protein [Stylosanthes scabra]
MVASAGSARVFASFYSSPETFASTRVLSTLLFFASTRFPCSFSGPLCVSSLVLHSSPCFVSPSLLGGHVSLPCLLESKLHLLLSGLAVPGSRCLASAPANYSGNGDSNGDSSSNKKSILDVHLSWKKL